MHYHLRNIKIYCELTTNGVIMKDYVKLTIVIVGVAAVSFLLSGCASIDCNTFRKTGDPELDQAFYSKCRQKQVQFQENKRSVIRKGLHNVDKVQEDLIDKVNKL